MSETLEVELISVDELAWEFTTSIGVRKAVWTVPDRSIKTVWFDPVNYAKIYKKIDGIWMHCGNVWCDGNTSINDIAEKYVSQSYNPFVFDYDEVITAEENQ